MNNSIVFFMGDHGSRHGKVRNSAIGAFEDNNPAMFVILPEKLRSNRDLYDPIAFELKADYFAFRLVRRFNGNCYG